MVKTYQKAAALLLALALIFAFPVTASAAETTEALKIIVVTPGTLEELANSFMNTAAGHTKASIVNG